MDVDSGGGVEEAKGGAAGAAAPGAGSAAGVGAGAGAATGADAGAAAGGGGHRGEKSRNVLVHPLTIITISDHYTRVSTGGGAQPMGSRIIGLLFGVQTGLDVSIFDAVEVACDVSPQGEVTLKPDIIEKQQELYTAVYPTYEIMGWYSVGVEATAMDRSVQRQMLRFNQSPLYLVMNPNPVQGAKDLPVTVYESEVHFGADQLATMIFVELKFQLETAQAEQISVEHVAKATPTDGISCIDLHATAAGTSLRTLQSRIKVLGAFLEQSKSGAIPVDYRLLRQLSSICSQLPAMEGQQFQQDFLREYNDSLAVTYLASVQKSTAALNNLTDKFVATHGDRHRHTLA